MVRRPAVTQGPHCPSRQAQGTEGWICKTEGRGEDLHLAQQRVSGDCMSGRVALTRATNRRDLVPTPQLKSLHSARMKAVRRTGTDAEVVVRRAVLELGYRYRCNVRSLPGSPDLANKTQKFAIFV